MERERPSLADTCLGLYLWNTSRNSSCDCMGQFCQHKARLARRKSAFDRWLKLAKTRSTASVHGVATVLLRCCAGVAPVLVPWVSLRYPLGSSWVALGSPEVISAHPTGFSVALRLFHRAPGWF